MSLHLLSTVLFFFLYFIQEYVTGHAAIARAHDVSHRACLACSSNVPRFWSDYDPGVATGVLTQATTLPEARCPCHPLPPTRLQAASH